tara:strand:- start:45 stop:359 length:315 start_codon:yes stop_codon:yes gene_type:complete
MAIEDFISEATSEIEEQKPLTKDVNGVVSELSDAEYDAKITALATQKDYNANQSYKDNRAVAYPPLGEQFDKLWHDINNGTLDNTGEFFTALKEVKDNNPKPGA